jgi:hypothetical protein
MRQDAWRDRHALPIELCGKKWPLRCMFVRSDWLDCEAGYEQKEPKRMGASTKVFTVLVRGARERDSWSRLGVEDDEGEHRAGRI